MLRFLRTILLSYLVCVSAGMIIFLALWTSIGLRIFTVQTTSMSPVVEAGDLALTVKKNAQDMQIGDIITYKNSHSVNVTHRIYSIDYQSGKIITKGDRLDSLDPPIISSQVEGKLVRIVPKGGSTLAFVRKPASLIFIVYIPALLIASMQINKLTGLYGSRRYTYG